MTASFAIGFATTALVMSSPAPREMISKINLAPLMANHTKLHMQKLLTIKANAYKNDPNPPALFSADGAAPVPFHQIFGTYVTPCEDFDCIVEGENGQPFGYIKCSSVAVERINMDSTVVTDLTVYVNDYGCVPNTTEVLSKMVIKSNISYHGNSKQPDNARGQLIQYAPTSVTATFNFQSEEYGLLAEMNKECPCSGQWHTNAARTIRPGQCTKYIPHEDRTQGGDMCNFVAGNSMYQTIKWVNYTDYVQSTGSFDKTTGWGEVLDNTLVNSLLPAAGSMDPEDCGYVEWAPVCQIPVEHAMNACSTCTGLECERCIWFFFNEKVGRDREWTECCPCLYYEAKKADAPWLKVNC